MTKIEIPRQFLKELTSNMNTRAIINDRERSFTGIPQTRLIYLLKGLSPECFSWIMGHDGITNTLNHVERLNAVIAYLNPLTRERTETGKWEVGLPKKWIDELPQKIQQRPTLSNRGGSIELSYQLEGMSYEMEWWLRGREQAFYNNERNSRVNALIAYLNPETRQLVNVRSEQRNAFHERLQQARETKKEHSSLSLTSKQGQRKTK